MPSEDIWHPERMQNIIMKERDVWEIQYQLCIAISLTAHRTSQEIKITV